VSGFCCLGRPMHGQAMVALRVEHLLLSTFAAIGCMSTLGSKCFSLYNAREALLGPRTFPVARTLSSRVFLLQLYAPCGWRRCSR